MNEVCNLLRPNIELYAEGELASSRLQRQVRRHLESCSECRAFLADYEALSWRLRAAARRSVSPVAVDVPESPPLDNRSRAERILQRLDRLPPPVAIEASPSRGLVPPPRSGPQSPAFGSTALLRRMASAAALIIVATIFYMVVFSSRTHEGPAGSMLSSEGGQLRPVALASRGGPRLDAGSFRDLRWVPADEVWDARARLARRREPSRGTFFFSRSRGMAPSLDDELALWVEVLDDRSPPQDALFLVPVAPPARSDGRRRPIDAPLPVRVSLSGRVGRDEVERTASRVKSEYRVVPVRPSRLPLPGRLEISDFGLRLSDFRLDADEAEIRGSVPRRMHSWHGGAIELGPNS